MTKSTPLNHDLYEILNLPSPTQETCSNTLSKQQIKLAYHKALLRHHPDKAKVGSDQSQTNPPPSTTTTTTTADRENDARTTPQIHTSRYTIDEITTAYKTLSDPFLRAEYDRSVRLDRLRAVAEREKSGDVYFHTGLEIVDLEDLMFDEEGEGHGEGIFWYRGCRCGDEKGFLVSEQDLEREAEHGEIVVGCRGCSLWMKILFAVEDDEGDGHEEGVGRGKS